MATVVTATLAGTVGLSTPAHAITCTYGTLFASNGSGLLYKYDSSGTLLGTVQLPATYFDLAFDSTSGTFYGIGSGGQIDVLNVQTGAFIRSVQARSGFYNSGSVLSGGTIAAAVGNMIVYINPNNGQTTDYFNMNLIQDENGNTYTGWSSAGDFITLADGSLLALLSNGNVPVTTAGTIVVKITNGAGIILGTVPGSWGGARVGTDLLLATATTPGEIRKISSLPTTAGRGPIATTVVSTLSSGNFYGAAGTEDSEAASCSTTGTNGYSAGADAFASTVANTPATAGSVAPSSSSPNPSSSSNSTSQVSSPALANTGNNWAGLTSAGVAMLLLGGIISSRKFLKKRS